MPRRSYNTPDAEHNRKLRNRDRKKYYRKTSRSAENRYQPWTVEELNMVIAHDITDSELSAKIGRSVQAIQLARLKCKKGIYDVHSEHDS